MEGHIYWEDTSTGRTHLLGGHVYREDTLPRRTRRVGGHVSAGLSCLVIW